MADLMVAVESFRTGRVVKMRKGEPVVDDRGNPIVEKPSVIVRAGQTYRTNDPVVKAHPHLFVPAETNAVATPVMAPPVEAATANPGEKRSTRRSG